MSTSACRTCRRRPHLRHSLVSPSTPSSIHPRSSFIHPASHPFIHSTSGLWWELCLTQEINGEWEYTTPPSLKVQGDGEVFFVESIVHTRKAQRLRLIQAEDRLRPFEHRSDHASNPLSASLPPFIWLWYIKRSRDLESWNPRLGFTPF